MDRDPPSCCCHTFRECVEGGWNAVELAAAVVRHDDPRGAVAHCELRVFAREHAFDPDGQVGDAAQPWEVSAPVEGGVYWVLVGVWRGEGGGTVGVVICAGAAFTECGDFGGGCEVEELQVRREMEAVADLVDAAAEIGRVDWESK